VLQTAAGAERWPCDDSAEADITGAFDAGDARASAKAAHAAATAAPAAAAAAATAMGEAAASVSSKEKKKKKKRERDAGASQASPLEAPDHAAGPAKHGARAKKAKKEGHGKQRA